ncbi:AMP-binding protein [Pseudoduganella sp. RAF53_2]|uniref:AMP-binding protein n=1 Tax=unclassified Pseudoduganella TaxID=2637179 RepID=UPI003F975492
MEVGVKYRMPGVVYPPQHELEAYVRDGLLGKETMPGALHAAFARYADKVALTGPEGDITFLELHERTERLAAGLLKLGLKQYDRVVFQLQNCYELVYAVVACWKAGLIPICTLAAHREKEIGYLANHAKAKAWIIQGDNAKFDMVAFAERLKAQIPSMEHIIIARAKRKGLMGLFSKKTEGLHLEDLMESVSFEDARRMLEPIEHDPYQVAVFQLSGGTTGVPKIIPRFHSEYSYNMRMVARAHGWTEKDVLFLPLPMIHNANMVCGWGPALLSGMRNIITPEVNPAVFFKVMAFYKPTWIGLVRPIMLKLQEAIAGKLLNFKGVKIISTNGSDIVRRDLQTVGIHVFGMTEGLVTFTRQSDSDEVRDRSVGYPISEMDQVKLLKPGTEEEVAVGEVGELAAKGPYTFHGYYDAEERNRQVFTSDGFYRSGDLISSRKIDGRVYYYFEGRIKDVIDRSGEKINCEEVEACLSSHPAVADCALVPMPSEMHGEQACAYVVLRGKHKVPSVEEMGRHLEALGLAKYKWPERIEAIDAIPTTKVGKPDKQPLRNMIAGLVEQEKRVRA